MLFICISTLLSLLLLNKGQRCHFAFIRQFIEYKKKKEEKRKEKGTSFLFDVEINGKIYGWVWSIKAESNILSLEGRFGGKSLRDCKDVYLNNRGNFFKI